MSAPVGLRCRGYDLAAPSLRVSAYHGEPRRCNHLIMERGIKPFECTHSTFFSNETIK